jgi:hypothetical protein
MQKTTWTLLAIIVAAATGGGAYYIIQHQTVEQPPSVVQQPLLPPAPAPKMPDDELTRRKLEGIGNTRDLKPVLIPQGNAR